ELGVQFQPGDALAQEGLDLGLLVAAGAVGERESGQVARQADAAGDDDVGLRPAAAQPFATGMSQAIQIHPWLPSFGASPECARPLRTVRRRPPPEAGAVVPPSPPPGPATAPAAGASCRRAASPGGCDVRAAPVPRGRRRSRASTRAGPGRETPYTLSR